MSRKTLAEVEAEIRRQQGDEADDHTCTCGHDEEYPCVACRNDRAWFIEKERAKRKAQMRLVDAPVEDCPF